MSYPHSEKSRSPLSASPLRSASTHGTASVGFSDRPEPDESQTFKSILFLEPEALARKRLDADAFHDLRIDQIVAGITANFGEYELKTFFTTVLNDPEEITYRQDVLRDLERAEVFDAITSFSQHMGAMRGKLEQSKKLSYGYQRMSALLSAAALYIGAVRQLDAGLRKSLPQSAGLRALQGYLRFQIATKRFHSLSEAAKSVRSQLERVRYCLLLEGRRITVRQPENEPDYSQEVDAAFARFKQGAAKDYRIQFPASRALNQFEEKIIDLVAELNPDAFSALSQFSEEFGDFADRTIATFDREVQFYISFFAHIAPLRAAGLKFCYPVITKSAGEISTEKGFDLALAAKLSAKAKPVVTNEFHLSNSERIFVVTGPNQGGKTTFARMFGQLHWLGCLGLLVPAASARLFLFDQIFTHFEREESISTLHGKLQEDLVRTHKILSAATARSIVIVNELFASTSLHDAVFLGRKILEGLSSLDLPCVFVTFLDELSTFNEKTVSVVAAISPVDPTIRTFLVERRPADGLSYALALSRKHRLGREEILNRIPA